MASRFWVGGTGTWDASTTTNWSATTGGAGGASVPGSSDSVTFDGASGGGVVTVNTTVTVVSITWFAFTGTIDFSVNNNNVTVSGGSGIGINGAGAGARKWLSGTGTFTFSSIANNDVLWDLSTTTNLDAGSVFNTCAMQFTGSGTGNTTFNGGGKSYGALTFGASAGGVRTISGANTYASLAVGAGNVLGFNNQTHTITAAMTLTGTSANPIGIRGLANVVATLAIAAGCTGTWMTIEGITFTGNTFVATNSLDMGRNTLKSITPPSTGGGGGSIVGA